MLWSELGAFMQRNGIERVMGCASVPMADGGRLAADLWHGLRQTYLAPLDEQVRRACRCAWRVWPPVPASSRRR